MHTQSPLVDFSSQDMHNYKESNYEESESDILFHISGGRTYFYSSITYCFELQDSWKSPYHSTQRTERPDEHPKIGFRDHVPVSHSGHGNKGPPQTQWNWVKIILWVWCDSLCVVDEAGEDDDTKDEEEDEQHQLFSGGTESLQCCDW